MKEISGGIATLVFTDRWLSQRGSHTYVYVSLPACRSLFSSPWV